MGINVGSPFLHERNLAKRASPILSDGTALSGLFNLDKREVKMRVLNDPEIHRLELTHIFARSWVIVGHVSEIPNAGDFVKRSIGQDQVIVTRARDGSVNILLNACAHRGMEICWADQGNQASFKCPYHGWVFDHSGNLLGAPFEKEMYGNWNKKEFGLQKAHVAVKHGVIFGAFYPLCDLDEWMGDFGWYFDSMYGGVELEVLARGSAPMRAPANWKAAAEQNCGDGYHTVTLHHCLVELGMLNPPPKNIGEWALDCYDVSSYEGHGLRVVEQSHGVFHVTPEPEPFPIGWFIAGAMFPGVNCGGATNRGDGVFTDDGTPSGRKTENLVRSAGIGAMSPSGPSHYKQWGAQLVQKDLPEAVKESMRRNAGFAVIVTDDLESWPSMTRVAEGAVGGDQPIRYNAILGPNNPEDFPGPGLVHRGMSKDDNQWHFWLRWYDLMTTPLAKAT